MWMHEILTVGKTKKNYMSTSSYCVKKYTGFGSTWGVSFHVQPSLVEFHQHAAWFDVLDIHVSDWIPTGISVEIQIRPCAVIQPPTRHSSHTVVGTLVVVLAHTSELHPVDDSLRMRGGGNGISRVPAESRHVQSILLSLRTYRERRIFDRVPQSGVTLNLKNTSSFSSSSLSERLSGRGPCRSGSPGMSTSDCKSHSWRMEAAEPSPICCNQVCLGRRVVFYSPMEGVSRYKCTRKISKPYPIANISGTRKRKQEIGKRRGKLQTPISLCLTYIMS